MQKQIDLCQFVGYLFVHSLLEGSTLSVECIALVPQGFEIGRCPFLAPVFPFVELIEAHLQQILLCKQARGLSLPFFHIGFQLFLPPFGRRDALIFGKCRKRIFLEIIHQLRAVSEAPETVFVVVRQLSRKHRPVRFPAQAPVMPVEARIMSLFQLFLIVGDEGFPPILTQPLELAHQEVFHYGLAEFFQVLVAGCFLLLAQLPVDRSADLDQFNGSIVEIPAEVFLFGLGLDLDQELFLGLGLIRQIGGAILRPEVRQDVAISVGLYWGGTDKEHSHQSQCQGFE